MGEIRNLQKLKKRKNLQNLAQRRTTTLRTPTNRHQRRRQRRQRRTKRRSVPTKRRNAPTADPNPVLRERRLEISAKQKIEINTERRKKIEIEIEIKIGTEIVIKVVTKIEIVIKIRIEKKEKRTLLVKKRPKTEKTRMQRTGARKRKKKGIAVATKNLRGTTKRTNTTKMNARTRKK